MFDFFKDKKILIIGGCLLVLLIGFVVIYYFNDNDEIIESSLVSVETTSVSTSNFYIDVKGAVKDPGVYLVSNGERVIDAIEKAGGLKKKC